MSTPNKEAGLSHKTIAEQRARMASQLCMAEHEFIEAKAILRQKNKQIEQLRGALAAHDNLLNLPPVEVIEPEPAKSEPTAKK